MAWDDEPLSSQQRDVASLPPKSTVVLAGPGTGKTWTIVRRIEYLLDVEGFQPDEILAVTFTRPAAAEMKDRIVERLGLEIGDAITVSTLHSYALSRLLAYEVQSIPMPVRVADDWEERHIIVEELARLLNTQVKKISNNKDGTLDRLADDWSTLRADDLGWDAADSDPAFLATFRRHREVYGYTMRSELVYRMLCELRQNPTFLTDDRIATLVVDEYQDLNMCDLTALNLASERLDAPLFACGDDDQSIYSFRHAHPAGIRELASNADVQSPTLTECRRCGPAIVELANWLIEQDMARIPKQLVSATAWDGSVELLRPSNPAIEADQIATSIADEIAGGCRPEDILVLFKADKGGKNSGPLDEALAARGVVAYNPKEDNNEVSNAGQRLVEYFRLSLSIDERTGRPTDHMSARAILTLEPGIGPTRLLAVVQAAFDNGMRFIQAVDYLAQNPSEFTSSGIEKVKAKLDSTLDRAVEIAPKPEETARQWAARVREVLNLPIGADEDVDGIFERAEELFSDEHFTEIAKVRQFQNSARNPSNDPVTSVEGKVTITTMHGAKGLGAEVVYVLQCEDEFLPGGYQTSLPDEAEMRRLVYVSLTRAKRRLVLSACIARPGSERYSGIVRSEERNLTRFLDGAPSFRK